MTGKRISRRTDGVVMTTDVRSTVDSSWEELKNLKSRVALKSTTSLLLSEVSYPRPRREFKLLKREVVYNFDVTKFKRRYLGGEKLQVSMLLLVVVFYKESDIRAVGL